TSAVAMLRRWVSIRTAIPSGTRPRRSVASPCWTSPAPLHVLAGERPSPVTGPAMGGSGTAPAAGGRPLAHAPSNSAPSSTESTQAQPFSPVRTRFTLAQLRERLGRIDCNPPVDPCIAGRRALPRRFVSGTWNPAIERPEAPLARGTAFPSWHAFRSRSTPDGQPPPRCPDRAPPALALPGPQPGGDRHAGHRPRRQHGALCDCRHAPPPPAALAPRRATG